MATKTEPADIPLATTISAPSSGKILESQVTYTGRWEKTRSSIFDLLCFAIFLAGCVAFFVSGFIVVGKKNFDPAQIDIFGNGSSPFSEELQQEVAECQAQIGAGRRLQVQFTFEERFFDTFGRDPYVVVTPMIILIVVAMVWLVALIKVARFVAWACTIISVVLPGFLGIVLIVEGVDSITTPVLLIVYTCVLGFLAYRFRADVDAAAEHMRLAVTILLKKPAVFLAASVIEVLFLIVMSAAFWFMVSSALIFESLPENFCVPSLATYSTKLQAFYGFFFFWIMHYFAASRLVVVAMTVAGFFFEDSKKPGNYAMHALKTTLTSSAPTISVGALITAVTEYIFQKTQDRFWFLDPIGCFLQCLLLIIGSCIQALTRFSLISHGISGEGFFGSATLAFNTIKQSGIVDNPNSTGHRAFLSAYINDRVAVSVTHLFSSSFAIVAGVIGWALADKATGQTTLGDLFTLIDSAFLFILFVFFFLWITKRPMFGLFAVILGTNWFPTPTYFVPPICGIFIACLGAVLLDFTASVVLNAIDTVFLLQAISKVNNIVYEGEKGQWAETMTGEAVALV